MIRVCSWLSVELFLVEEVAMYLEYGNAILANTMADNYVDEGSSICKYNKKSCLSEIRRRSFILFYLRMVFLFHLIRKIEKDQNDDVSK